MHCLGNAEGNCEYDKSHRIVKRDDGEQQVGQRALCLVLAHDHERCRGRRGGRNGAEGDAGGYRELFLEENVHDDEGHINENGGGDRL